MSLNYKKKRETYSGLKNNWVLSAVLIGLGIGIVFLLRHLLFQPGELPPDVQSVKSKAKEVYLNEKGFWEADYGGGMVMVYIPAGRFTRGSNVGKGEEKDEIPEHEVHLDAYWMGKYEVTLGQYKEFVAATGHRQLPDYVATYSPGADHPAVGVSWEDADACCRWLSKKMGLEFKLPTEAQWEKAARGTDGRLYPWGNDPPNGKRSNFADKQFVQLSKRNRWVNATSDDGYAYTAPVGSYTGGASPYGLYDMAGNVWEWCRDWYQHNYYKNSPRENPTGPGDGGGFPVRVVRGCSFDYPVEYLRCSNRAFVKPSVHQQFLGFRLCQEVR